MTSYTAEIDAALASALNEFTDPGELYAPVQYLFEAGGKRVRPILTLLACEAVGGDRRHAMSAAVAVEMLHNFTLMHDDIMDRSPMRRGRATVHMKYDENTAILSGDVMIGMALRLLERSAEHAPQPLEVIRAFTTGLIEVCEGQSLDMSLAERHDVTVDEYFTMIDKKTAKLLEMSVAIGASVAGATSEQLGHLTTFAREIGIAFQMQDDLLDLRGSEEFGKAPGGDIVEGKRTWLILRTRDKARAAGPHMASCAAVVDDFFANNGLPRERVADMAGCMHTLGVLEEAEAEIRRITEDAYDHLHALPVSPAREALEDLASKLVVRTS